MEDIIDIIVTETTNLIEITSQPTDEIIDVNIIDNREDITLNVTPTVVEININSLTGNFGILWGEIEGTLSNQTDLQNALNLKADLVDGKVPSSQLPSYVDDVVEVANYAALPVTGEVGKIYITLDTNFIYRWTGSTYVEIKDSSAVWGAITGTLSNQTDLQSALNAKQDDLNGTGFVKASGTTITYDNTSYLPLTGGTLTGNLNGTNITISNSLIAKGGTFNGGASSSGIITMDGLGSDLLMNRADTSNGSSITFLTNAVEKWNIGLRSAGTTDNFFIYNSNLTANALTINSATSAATFASSATATKFILSGGTGNTGLYYGHTDRVVLANYTTGGIDFEVNGGSIVATLFPSGNYGLGVALDAGYKLDVNGTVRISGALSGTSATFSGRTNASTLYVNSTEYTFANFATAVIGVRPNNDGISALWLRPSDASNNVGTAIQSTSSAFTIGSLVAGPYLSLALSTGAATFSSSVTAKQGIFDDTLGGNIIYKYNGTNDWVLGENSGVLSRDFNLYNYNTNSVNFTVLRSNGNVGIGTTAIDAKLDVYTDSGNNIYLSTVSKSSVNIAAQKKGVGYTTLDIEAQEIKMFTATAERMRITSGGYVKASNSGSYYSVGADYHELRTTVGDAILRATNTSTNPYGISVYFTGADPNNTSLYVYNAVSSFSGTSLYSIWSNGTTSGRSDARLKKNIVDSTPKLDKLMQLRIVNYEWKESLGGSKELGLIAQEVEEVFPNLIITEPVVKEREITLEDGTKEIEKYEDGDYKSLKNSVLPYITIKALQELTEEVRTLKAELDTLKNK